MGVFIGIDPGVNGALALYDPEGPPRGNLVVEDIPVTRWRTGTKKHHKVDLHAFSEIIERWAAFDITLAIVEDVSAMPKQGVTSTFNFGFTTGVCNMVLVAHKVPIERVRPHAWKKALGLVGQDKDASRAVAAQQMPWHAYKWNRKKDDGRAEAALLALYGSRLHEKNLIEEGIC